MWIKWFIHPYQFPSSSSSSSSHYLFIHQSIFYFHTIRLDVLCVCYVTHTSNKQSQNRNKQTNKQKHCGDKFIKWMNELNEKTSSLERKMWSSTIYVRKRKHWKIENHKPSKMVYMMIIMSWVGSIFQFQCVCVLPRQLNWVIYTHTHTQETNIFWWWWWYES